MARFGTRWLLASLLLAGCAAGPTVGAAYDTKDPVDRWQAALRANAARYVCGAALEEGREGRLADAMVEAQRQATEALAKRDDTAPTDPEVLGDIASRRTQQERVVRDAVAARGCSDPQIMDLIGLAERLSAGQG
jgi:membrane-bound ClpP family serine protease